MSYGLCQAEACDRAARSTRGLCEDHLRVARSVCSERGCGKPIFARGLCSAAYNRHRRAGTLPPKLSPAELAIKAGGISLPAKSDMNSSESHERAAMTRTRSWRLWLKGTLRPEDQDALRIAEPLAAALIADKGGREGLSAGEAALIQQILLARVASLLCVKALALDAPFFVNADGERVASAALRELPKFLGAERQALQALGLERRPPKTISLRDIIEGSARELPAGVDAAPVEIEAVSAAAPAGPSHESREAQP